MQLKGAFSGSPVEGNPALTTIYQLQAMTCGGAGPFASARSMSLKTCFGLNAPIGVSLSRQNQRAVPRRSRRPVDLARGAFLSTAVKANRAPLWVEGRRRCSRAKNRHLAATLGRPNGGRRSLAREVPWRCAPTRAVHVDTALESPVVTQKRCGRRRTNESSSPLTTLTAAPTRIGNHCTNERGRPKRVVLEFGRAVLFSSRSAGSLYSYVLGADTGAVRQLGAIENGRGRSHVTRGRPTPGGVHPRGEAGATAPTGVVRNRCRRDRRLARDDAA